MVFEIKMHALRPKEGVGGSISSVGMKYQASFEVGTNSSRQVRVELVVF